MLDSAELEWLGAGPTPLKSFCGTGLDVDERPLSVFFCFLRGSGDWEQCREQSLYVPESPAGVENL